MYESEDKMVSHPSHYCSESGLQVMDVIESFTGDLKGIEAFDTSNVIKYICRWKHKNGLQDLEKAMWYLQHLIDHVKNQCAVLTVTNGDRVEIDSSAYADQLLNKLKEAMLHLMLTIKEDSGYVKSHN